MNIDTPDHDNMDDVAYLLNGELNVTYILSNANLLFKEGEYLPAISLFRLVKNHEKYGYCGHYGLGQCFLKLGTPEQAARAFEKAFSLARRAYIAASWIESLILLKDFSMVEKKALEFAQEFASETRYVEYFRRQYGVALQEAELK